MESYERKLGHSSQPVEKLRTLDVDSEIVVTKKVWHPVVWQQLEQHIESKTDVVSNCFTKYITEKEV